jgi:hypothetical protein
MRIFNRIVMILLLAGLFVLGIYMVVYAFELFDYSLGSLPFSGISNGLQGFANDVEQGSLAVIPLVILVLLVLLGLLLLIAELQPPAPSRVRMGNGTYTTRRVVEDEVSAVADEVPGVLGSSVSAKAQRRPGAQVDLEGRVRHGDDVGPIKSSLRSRVQEHLSRRGLPVSKLNVKLVEADPRQTKTRVQ